jgi:predicted patatin/cPLA2 family phospholipase
MCGAMSSHTASRVLLVEGGGLRGAFGAGVLEALLGGGFEQPAAFDDVIAVSSGAPTAAYAIAGQIADGVRIWEQYTSGDQLISPRNLLRGAPLMDIDRLVGVFERVVPLAADRLGSARTRLWIGVTDCRNGEGALVRATPSNVFSLLRATMALPVAYGKVVRVGGVPYVDGGVAAAVPIARVSELGGWSGSSGDAPRPLAILTQPRGYRRTSGRVSALLMASTYPRWPALRRALLGRTESANRALDRVDELEGAGALSVIRPARALSAKRLSTRREDIVASIDAGRVAGRAWLRANR